MKLRKNDGRPRTSFAVASVTLALAMLLAACGDTDEEVVDDPPAEEEEEEEEEVDEPADEDDPAEEDEAAADIHPACDGDEVHDISINASVSGLLYLAHHIADVEGFYDDYNVNVTYQELGGGSIPALLAGDSNVAMTATNRAFTLRNEGRDVKGFGMGIAPLTSTFVIAQEVFDEAGLTEDSSLEDKMQAVEGTVLGTTSPGAGADVILRAMLREGGLDPENDVEILYLEEGPAVLAAFDRRDIQGFTFGPPTSTTAIEQSDGEILVALARGDYEPWNDLSLVAHIAETDWLEENRDAAGCWLAAMQDAHDLINQDEQRARDIGQEYVGLEDDDLYNLAFDQMFGAWPEEVCFTAEDRELDYELAEGASGVDDPNEDHWDTSICEEYVTPFRNADG